MTCFSHSLVGLMEIEPRELALGISESPRDDATLESWFESIAVSTIPGAESCERHRPGAAYPLLCASGRFSRGSHSSGSNSVRADLGRLVEDLQFEYERLVAS